MRLQKVRLKAADLPLLLEPAVVLDGLAEDLDGLLLAASDDLAPTHEESMVCHDAPPAFDARGRGA